MATTAGGSQSVVTQKRLQEMNVDSRRGRNTETIWRRSSHVTDPYGRTRIGDDMSIVDGEGNAYTGLLNQNDVLHTNGLHT